MEVKSSEKRRPLTGPRPAVVVKRHPDLEAPCVSAVEPPPPPKRQSKQHKRKRTRRAR